MTRRSARGRTPWWWLDTQHQLALQCRLGVIVRHNDGLKRLVIFSMFQGTDHRFGCQPMPNGSPGAQFAFLGVRTGALAGIAAVRVDLLERCHGISATMIGFVS